VNVEKSKRFQDLLVWQKSHHFVLAAYKYTQEFPTREIYGLVSQMRRSSVSIPANIAEGFKKKSRVDKAPYFNIAQGSIEETRYYIILSHDLGYGDGTQMLEQLDEVSRILNGYLKGLLNSVS